jgi:hypothetical protein
MLIIAHFSLRPWIQRSRQAEAPESPPISTLTGVDLPPRRQKLAYRVPSHGKTHQGIAWTAQDSQHVAAEFLCRLFKA